MTQAEKGVLIAEIKVVEFWMDFKMTIVNKINSLFINLAYGCEAWLSND